MLKIVKRFELGERQSVVLRIASVLAALVAAALIILCMGHDPIDVFRCILRGSFGNKRSIVSTIEVAIPLIMMALGVAVAFKMKFLNIGAEGQFYMGAFGCAIAARTFTEMPSYLLLPIMFLFGFVFGAAYALIPAFLRSRFGTSETLVTLMMNYIATLFITYLKTGPWQTQKQGGNAIDPFGENALLPEALGVHIGWIVVIVATVIVFIMLKYTKLGFEISVVGENINTARYAGMNVNGVLFSTAAISGGLCGIAGMLQASGVEGTITDHMSAGMGFTAIIVAWLACLSPIAIVVVGVLFSLLLQGSNQLQIVMQIPTMLSDVIQGIILFFVLASEFFINYKIIFTRKIKAKVGGVTK